jgi:isopenicillin N synthase-like dioxygenase
LQVERNGQWNSVLADRGELIINVGDVVQVWSNDKYLAPIHRVLASSEFERFSAPFFLNPSFESYYAPLPAACTEESARYKPINWGAFRAGRAAGDYANYGEEIQIAHFRV